MKLFEQIRKKYEQKAQAKTQRLEEQKLKQEQIVKQEREAKENAMREEVERNQQYIKELMASYVDEDFILELKYDVWARNGKYAYSIHDYFISDKKRYRLHAGDKFSAVKISGDNMGDRFNGYIEAPKKGNHYDNDLDIKLFIEGVKLEGSTRESAYIPSKYKTAKGISVRELSIYANERNNIRREDYIREKLRMEQQIRANKDTLIK